MMEIAEEVKAQEDPYTRLAKALVADAIKGAAKGNLNDAFWLISREAEWYLDAAEITQAAMLRWVAKTILEGSDSFLELIPKAQHL